MAAVKAEEKAETRRGNQSSSSALIFGGKQANWAPDATRVYAAGAPSIGMPPIRPT